MKASNCQSQGRVPGPGSQAHPRAGCRRATSGHQRSPQGEGRSRRGLLSPSSLRRAQRTGSLRTARWPRFRTSDQVAGVPLGIGPPTSGFRSTPLPTPADADERSSVAAPSPRRATWHERGYAWHRVGTLRPIGRRPCIVTGSARRGQTAKADPQMRQYSGPTWSSGTLTGS